MPSGVKQPIIIIIRALATTDDEYQLSKLLLWNWGSGDAGRVAVRLHGGPSADTARCVRLNAQPSVMDDNAYLTPFLIEVDRDTGFVELGPYAVVFCYFHS